MAKRFIIAMKSFYLWFSIKYPRDQRPETVWSLLQMTTTFRESLCFNDTNYAIFGRLPDNISNETELKLGKLTKNVSQ